MSNPRIFLQEPGPRKDLRYVWRVNNRRRHEGLFRILWIDMKDLFSLTRPISLP